MRDGIGGFVWSVLSLCIAIYVGIVIVGAVTNRTYQENYSARYSAYQQGETLRTREREVTARVQAEQWNGTLRTWGQWGGGALAVCVVAGAGAWAVVRWQEERSRRHVVSAQERIVLAYIGMYGGRMAQLEQPQAGYAAGTLGVVSGGEFIPWQVARAELPAHALFEMRGF